MRPSDLPVISERSSRMLRWLTLIEPQDAGHQFTPSERICISPPVIAPSLRSISDQRALSSQAPAPPRVDIEFNDSVDRVHKAAELFHAGKAPYLIVTGGNQPWSTSQKSEADLIRDLLVQWKVPREVILLEASSRNTRENALYTKNAVDSIHCDEALLVTSAAHMPRAMAAFRAVGINPTPVSTDVRAAKTSHLKVIDFLPDARALEMSSDAIREMVGQWVYELKGWN